MVLKGNIETRRAHPAISDGSHMLLKCRMATNISQWLKVQSKWFKNYIFVKKCILISFWIFQYCFYYLLCHILVFGCLNFSIPPALMGVNSLEPDQARNYVGSDQGSTCLQRLSADSKSRT